MWNDFGKFLENAMQEGKDTAQKLHSQLVEEWNQSVIVGQNMIQEGKEAIDKGTQRLQSAVVNEWNQSVKAGQQIIDALYSEAKKTLQYDSIENEEDTQNAEMNENIPSESSIALPAPIMVAPNNEAQIKESENKEYGEGMEALLCPISNELMTDPVMTPYGHCYQRQNIEMWLDNHNTCPLTCKNLRKDQLIPCFTVKAAVEQYIIMQEQKRHKDPNINE